MRKILASITLLLITTYIYGQNSSGTPYSKEGFGLLPDNYGAYMGMGGVSAAMRDNYNINYINPASYTALDSVRFYFQTGITAEYVDISSHKIHTHYTVAQNGSVSMAFRAYKKLYMSLGIMQRSNRGFDVYFSDNVRGDFTQYCTQQIEGNGGLNEAYLGLGYQLGQLSVGANISYLFGRVDDRLTMVLQPATSGYYIKTQTVTQMSAALFTLGAQMPFKIGKKSDFVVGTSFNFGTPLHARQTFLAYKMSNTSSSTIPLNNESLENGTIFYPFRITAGASYQYNRRWFLAGDYTFQNMSQYEEFGTGKEYQNYHKVALGGSYQPNATGRYWWQRNKYTAGAYFTRSHLEFNLTDINTYGVTVGGQIPIRTNFGQELLLGIAVDLGMRGTHKNNQILEKYAKLRINIAFKEIWFMKAKIY